MNPHMYIMCMYYFCAVQPGQKHVHFPSFPVFIEPLPKSSVSPKWLPPCTLPARHSLHMLRVRRVTRALNRSPAFSAAKVAPSDFLRAEDKCSTRTTSNRWKRPLRLARAFRGEGKSKEKTPSSFIRNTSEWESLLNAMRGLPTINDEVVLL